MPATHTTTRKFSINLSARRYANSPERLLTLDGEIESTAGTPAAELIKALGQMITERSADEHAIGRVDFTLHSES